MVYKERLVKLSGSAGPTGIESANKPGWTGSGSGSYTGAKNPASVKMNGPITETADFPPYCAPSG